MKFAKEKLNGILYYIVVVALIFIIFFDDENFSKVTYSILAYLAIFWAPGFFYLYQVTRKWLMSMLLGGPMGIFFVAFFGYLLGLFKVDIVTSLSIYMIIFVISFVIRYKKEIMKLNKNEKD